MAARGSAPCQTRGRLERKPTHMKTVHGFLTLILGIAVLAAGTQAQPNRYDALADSAMAESRPTPETAKLLREELLFQRATQVYLWALALINTLGRKVGSEKAFGAG